MKAAQNLYSFLFMLPLLGACSGGARHDAASTQAGVVTVASALSAPAPLGVLGLVGANYNFFAPCTGASGTNGVQVVPHYDVNRNAVQSQLSAMHASGMGSLKTLVFFYRGATTDPNTSDGVINMASDSLVQAYLQNILNYATDVRAAGFSRLTIGFNPMRLNSPLSYVRNWTNPGGPAPAYCADEVAQGQSPYQCATENAQFMSKVINQIRGLQNSGFEIYFDLLSEANTASHETDPVALDYVRYIWQWYVSTYGADYGGFEPVLDSSNVTNASGKSISFADDFAWLLTQYTKVQTGGAPQFPRLHMFQFYNVAESDDQADADYVSGGHSLAKVAHYFDQFSVPQDHRRVQIAETWYDYAPTVRQALYAAANNGLAIEELMVWPGRMQDVFYSTLTNPTACAVTAANPYEANLALDVRNHGLLNNVSHVLNAGYYEPNNALWIQFSGQIGVVPLFANIYDASGHYGERSLPVQWSNSSTPTVYFSPDASMQSVLGANATQVSLWMSDGSTTPHFSIAACGPGFVGCK